MAASTTQNPAVRSESKSAKKKKAKAESSEPPALSANAEVTPSNGANESNQGDGAYESPYIKELYKSIRNVNKKITNASKVDNILAENPGKDLDELVATRKINADQKAQILKKPALQASLLQLEEQISQYKKFDQEYKARSQAEKAEFEKSFTDRAAKELEEKVTAVKEEAIASASKDQQNALLLLSQFLRLAAIRRGDEEADPNLDENKALEGVLAVVYGGDQRAVDAMINLIQGAEVPTAAITGETLATTYAEIKTATLEHAPPATITETTIESAEEGVETSEHLVQSDPTIVNAGLTELDEPAVTSIANGQDVSQEAQGIPQNSGFGDGGNAAAEANWDTNNELSNSQEWVEVHRDATETDTGLTATPAAPSNVQSWADDQPDNPTEIVSAPAINPNDGFHEVQRSRGGNRDGQQRGRGGRGDGRGRGGFRGDFRGGRGRGGPRGGARGGRGRPEES